ncbi:helix-turn-helix domain-containing protein [Sphingopyxis sp. JAI128]|uniref:helix-turn-helix domain-containing protein n=1 Tax=Sphingopyxis sp. JAI128 TaxID=2723066 RepID=UPI00160B8267|nr:helix-turn-helix domain-containing protein [Sphingopyxis sp. JAI128]MBB6424970.1 chromosomal replication initiation ATPase DnaA [Sphingopyxis sp. JAI128]
MIPTWYTPPPYIAITDRELVAHIARVHSMTAADLIGPAKHRAVCIVRWRAMKALRDKGRSLSSIARTFNRDHSSVSYALRRAG